MFDHTSIALERITDALPLFRDVLGGEFVGGMNEGAFRWVQLQYPNGSKIELMDPNPGDNFLRRYLDRRGTGMHHITFKVEDLAAAIEIVKAAGYQVVDENLSNPGWKEAFIHPRSAHGALVQLAESPYDEGAEGSPIQGDSAEKLLAE
jgi:methylmalonyl-CoA/ethylmalonyl-CoA epimerase